MCEIDASGANAEVADLELCDVEEVVDNAAQHTTLPMERRGSLGLGR